MASRNRPKSAVVTRGFTFDKKRHGPDPVKTPASHKLPTDGREYLDPFSRGILHNPTHPLDVNGQKSPRHAVEFSNTKKQRTNPSERVKPGHHGPNPINDSLDEEDSAIFRIRY